MSTWLDRIVGDMKERREKGRQLEAREIICKDLT